MPQRPSTTLRAGHRDRSRISKDWLIALPSVSRCLFDSQNSQKFPGDVLVANVGQKVWPNKLLILPSPSKGDWNFQEFVARDGPRIITQCRCLQEVQALVESILISVRVEVRIRGEGLTRESFPWRWRSPVQCGRSRTHPRASRNPVVQNPPSQTAKHL